MSLSLLRSGNRNLTRSLFKEGCLKICSAQVLNYSTDSGEKQPQLSPQQVKKFVESEIKRGGNVGLTKKERLKIIIKDYGKTVIAFHIAISLMSLGIFYSAVSYGLDLTPMIKFILPGENALSKFNDTIANSSNFLIAYTIHKLFAPVRLSITVASAPILVKRLRILGILKHPIPTVTIKK